MFDLNMLLRIVSALVCACFFTVATLKLAGVAQQAGYRSGGIGRWLCRKGNVFMVRMLSWTLLLAFSVVVTSLAFSFVGEEYALIISAVPFLGFSLMACIVDSKFVLKVPVKYTGRVKRLVAVYFLLVACVTYAVIAVCSFVFDFTSAYAGDYRWLYGLLRYAPVAILPVLLPLIFMLANLILYPFEGLHNRRFVKKAEGKLAEKEGLKVAIVGSYGKTSVKQILRTILSQKYAVCATPASFNTPMGIAKTVFGGDFDDCQVFIAEMGARKKGDVKVLAEAVKPDYAIFTGVCAQHIATFRSLDGVKEEKCEILRCGAKKVVCGATLKEDIAAQFDALTKEQKESVLFVTGEEIQDLQLLFNGTKFNLAIGEETYAVDVPLLGKHSAENISLCVMLAKEMGLTKEEIEKGLAALQPVEHRLQLIEENGVYIVDDAYNANERGAMEAIDALCRFEGRKIIVTPGLVETGVLEAALCEKLGNKLAAANLDKIILVGDTLVAPVKKAYEAAGGDKDKMSVVFSLEKAKGILAEELAQGDAVLFLNDLPDVY